MSPNLGIGLVAACRRWPPWRVYRGRPGSAFMLRALLRPCSLKSVSWPPPQRFVAWVGMVLQPQQGIGRGLFLRVLGCAPAARPGSRLRFLGALLGLVLGSGLLSARSVVWAFSRLPCGEEAAKLTLRCAMRVTCSINCANVPLRDAVSEQHGAWRSEFVRCCGDGGRRALLRGRPRRLTEGCRAERSSWRQCFGVVVLRPRHWLDVDPHVWRADVLHFGVWRSLRISPASVLAGKVTLASAVSTPGDDAQPQRGIRLPGRSLR